MKELLWWLWTEATKWASVGYQRRLTRGVLLLPEDDNRMFLLSADDLCRLTARARYCPSEIARGLVPVAEGVDMVASTIRKCTLATAARFDREVVCVEYIEPGELRPRYHVATNDGDGIPMPPWSYERQRITPPGVKSIGINPKGDESTTDCTRDIKGMTGTGTLPPIEVVTYLLWLLLRQSSSSTPLPPLSDCEFWCTHRSGKARVPLKRDRVPANDE